MIAEKDLAYIAGLLDGEGCISIYKTERGVKQKSPRYDARVHITNTHLPTLIWVRETVGVGRVHKQKTLIGNKQIWCYSLCNRQAIAFVELITPYLRIKSEQAAVLIAFAALSKRHTNPNGRIPQEITEKREGLRLQITKAKHLITPYKEL